MIHLLIIGINLPIQPTIQFNFTQILLYVPLLVHDVNLLSNLVSSSSFASNNKHLNIIFSSNSDFIYPIQAFKNEEQTGWAQSQECELRCEDSNCQWIGSKSSLSLHKLLRDLHSLASVSLSNLAEFDSLAFVRVFIHLSLSLSWLLRNQIIPDAWLFFSFFSSSRGTLSTTKSLEDVDNAVVFSRLVTRLSTSNSEDQDQDQIESALKVIKALSKTPR